MDKIIIYNTEDGAAKVNLYANDGTVWLTQAQMAELFQTSKQNIGQHLNHCFAEGELEKNSVIKFFFTTAADGKKYSTAFYHLSAILAVGFRVRSPRGTEFRRWATTTLQEYLQKGFLIDAERLKNPDGRPDYFDELLTDCSYGKVTAFPSAAKSARSFLPLAGDGWRQGSQALWGRRVSSSSGKGGWLRWRFRFARKGRCDWRQWGP